MKPSQYATLIEYDSDRAYLYSTLYKTVIRLDRRSADAWKRGQWDDVFANGKTRTLARRYLVADKLDEFPLALHYLLYPPGMIKTLYATVVVTMQCNMACVYCHETGRLNSTRMDRATAGRAGQFISRIAGEGRFGRVVLYFYGGEPLLNMEAMQEVVAGIRELCRAEISIFISTNGFLLTEVRAEQLRALSDDIHLQVTVDGPPSVHDSRRPGRGRGAPTYAAILDNIIASADKVPVAIRTNVDKENISAVPDLLDDLLNLQLLPERVCWYAFPVASVIDGDPEINARAYTYQEWAAAAGHIWRAQAERHIPLNGTELGDGLCGISRRSVFTIDSSGGIHQCTGLHSRADTACATIDGEDIPWTSHRPGDFPEKCRMCAYFPFCGGGCKAHAAACGQKPDCSEAYFADILPIFLKYKYSLD